MIFSISEEKPVLSFNLKLLLTRKEPEKVSVVI